MSFIKDLYRDEIRSGWLVSSDVKKSWERMLEIWQELDRICRKYKINYWAYCGTLLGAVRHKGFVPWDTDMDLCMLRPEYNIFCDAVERELIREGGLFEIGHKKFNNFRIAMTATAMLGEDDLSKKEPDRSYGMMVEVYPLDVAQDNTFEGNSSVYRLLELFTCLVPSGYALLQDRVKNGQPIFSDWDFLARFRSLSEKAKQDFYNNYAAMLFDNSSSVGWIEDRIKAPQKIYEKEIFNETIYLPFESIKLPAPVGYEKMLTALYGDWHKLVYDNTFRIGAIYSPDISYREIFKRVDLEFMFSPKDKEL